MRQRQREIERASERVSESVSAICYDSHAHREWLVCDGVSGAIKIQILSLSTTWCIPFKRTFNFSSFRLDYKHVHECTINLHDILLSFAAYTC